MKQKASTRFVSVLLNILSTVLYPLIVLFGLVTILFVAIVTLFQKYLSTKRYEKVIDEEQTFTAPWSVLTEQGKLNIFGQYAGEVRFGPVYLHLKSDPEIPFLADKIFGDWSFNHNNLLFLQQWISTDKPNTNLIVIDIVTFDTNTLLENIPSVLWDVVETEPNNLQLTCDTGNEMLNYLIKGS